MGALARLHERKDDLLRLAQKCGAENLRVFGSVARGEGGLNAKPHVILSCNAKMVVRVAL